MLEFKLSALIYATFIGVFLYSLKVLYDLFKKKKYKTMIVIVLVYVAFAMGLVRTDNSRDLRNFKNNEQMKVIERTSEVPKPKLHKKESYESRMEKKSKQLREDSKERMNDYINDKVEKEDEEH